MASWRDVLPIHPAADLFPLMAPDELKALGEDIKKNGLTSPIAIVTRKDAKDWRYQLLDGRNRLDAMELVGVRFDLMLRHGDCVFIYGDDQALFKPRIINSDPYAFVISANIHRRHLTAEQKREIIAKVLKAAPEKSNRQIAETTKASHVTVGAVRAELKSTGQIDQLTKTVGKDGKARAKKHPIQPKPSTPSDCSHRGVSEVRPPTEKLTSGLPAGSISEKTSGQQTTVEETSAQPAESATPIASPWWAVGNPIKSGSRPSGSRSRNRAAHDDAPCSPMRKVSSGAMTTTAPMARW